MKGFGPEGVLSSLYHGLFEFGARYDCVRKITIARFVYVNFRWVGSDVWYVQRVRRVRVYTLISVEDVTTVFGHFVMSLGDMVDHSTP